MKKPILLTDLDRRVERIERILLLLRESVHLNYFKNETFDMLDLLFDIEIELENVNND